MLQLQLRPGRAPVLVVTGLALLAGCGPGETDGETGPTTASPAPSDGVDEATSPADDEAASSAAGEADGAQAPETLMREERDLEAGTYRVDLAGLGASAPFPALDLTVPEGWWSLDGWALVRKDETVAVSFWDVERVYADSCRWRGALQDPGPGVEDLVAALMAVPDRKQSEPVDVQVDDFSGTYLEWSVPEDLEVDEDGNFVSCDDTGYGEKVFLSWTAADAGLTRGHQGPGQLDRLWVLDVEGERLVIDAFVMPDASEEAMAEVDSVVGSIDFVETP